MTEANNTTVRTNSSGSSMPTFSGGMEELEEDESGVAVRSAYVAIALGGVSSLICLMTLVAILHTRRPIAVNLQFVFSLLCSDLLTSTSVISKLSYEVHRSNEPLPCATIFMDGLRMTAHIAAFFNLCLIAMDMHVAILNPLRYAAMINSFRVKILISFSWGLAFLLGFSALYVPSTSYNPEQISQQEDRTGNTSLYSDSAALLRTRTKLQSNATDEYYTEDTGYVLQETFGIDSFCMAVFTKEYDSLFATLAVLILSAIIMISIYVKIFCTIKRIHKTDDETAKSYGTKMPKHSRRRWAARIFMRSKADQQLSTSACGGASSEANRTRRGLVTTMIILAVFCVCFLPYFLADAASAIIFFSHRTSSMPPSGAAETYMLIIQHYTFFLYDILMLNSILDPVIYALRMREVRIGYRKLFRIKSFVRHSATGLSSRFGTSDGVAFDMTASGCSSVRRGVTASDSCGRNGRSASTFIAQPDNSYDRLVRDTSSVSPHDRIDLASSNSTYSTNFHPLVSLNNNSIIDNKNSDAGEHLELNANKEFLTAMTTSMNSSKTSTTLVDTNDIRSTRPTNCETE